MGAVTDPVYLRVLEDLRERIRGGMLPPGARVPSRNAIIAKYGVGETAAKHALQVLATEGLIEARAGSGSYVRKVPAACYLDHDRLHYPGSPFGLDETAQAPVRRRRIARGGRPARTRPGPGARAPPVLGAPERARDPAAAHRAAAWPGARRGLGHEHQVPAHRRLRAGAAGHELRARPAHRGHGGRAARAGPARRPGGDRADGLDRDRCGPGRGGAVGTAVAAGRGRRARPAARGASAGHRACPPGRPARRSRPGRSSSRRTGSGSGTGSRCRRAQP